MKHGFVDKRAQITTILISSCHWETLVPFCLRKKRPENAFLTLIVPSKTTINWLFNDVWCYLFSACFDWKIVVNKQTNSCKGLSYR